MANKAEQLKIILLGDEKVGKSSFFNKFVNGTFTEEYSPSLKAQFKKVDFNLIGEQLEINIWDTPGNEQKHKIYNSIYFIQELSMRSFFYHGVFLQKIKNINI